MVKYGGFFNNILIHETITKVKGGSVCVGDGGGGEQLFKYLFTNQEHTKC